VVFIVRSITWYKSLIVDYSEIKYENDISGKTQLSRLLWALAWILFFRPTPRWCFHGWRRGLLRIFGAKVGEGSKIDPTCRIWAPWNLNIGSFTALGEGVDCYCVARIEIGSKVAVSQRTFLCSASHDISSLQRPLIRSSIKIEDHAWICAQAFIGPGICLGEGSVVAACAVVTKDVSAWEVVGGNPAKKIKIRNISDGSARDKL
jgi:putative colanic acid biosynthesis acetyltransferase WcaF